MLHSFGIVCLICAFAQMVIGETSNTFKAAVYEHAVHLPNVSIVPMQRDQAVEAMMVNIRVYQETATLAASMERTYIFPQWVFVAAVSTRHKERPDITTTPVMKVAGS
ncbi:pantetheine hydrolase VNN2-like [Dreissena polymorpha]|uniref:pantetheine hydrolase VNN2-like n=1 Tax=Dreissena polymorpha TaxID=45954 RepID=UPI0022641ECE|nr:pantetheine hydrolase VNN2-like [Dreissena polymorpha]